MPDKIAVLYKTKYGSAKRYAEWIASEADGDLFDSAKIAVDRLMDYDTIVYIGSLYAVGILGFASFMKNYDRLKDKRLIVVTVGASPAYPEAVEHVKKSNFTDEMQQRVPYFHLRGAFDYSRLNAIDKTLMFLLKKKIQFKKTDERSSDEIGMLASYKRPTDWTSKKHILPILECIKGSNTQV